MNSKHGQFTFVLMVLITVCCSQYISALTAYEWHDLQCVGHAGCTAGPIQAGSVYKAVAGYFYIPHEMKFEQLVNTDVDCRKTIGLSEYVDVAETYFRVTWRVQRYNIDHWVDVDLFTVDDPPYSGISLDTTSFVPDCLYQVIVTVDDTPNDDPGGDDEPQYRASPPHSLFIPMIATVSHVGDPYPVIDSPAPGFMTEQIVWTSWCGHVEHLNYITLREKVTLESEFTENGIHDHSHGGDNCFTGTMQDPFYSGTSGAVTGWITDIYGMATEPSTPYKVSKCTATQIFQQSKGWPTPPSITDQTASWVPISFGPFAIEYEVVEVEDNFYIGVSRNGECAVARLE